MIDSNYDILSILKTKTVLYAEDKIEVAQNTIEILNIYFKEVLHVFNGKEAVDAFTHKEYDVLILDICMPGMDGLEAIEKIRQYNYKTPIIILSAFAEKEHLWRAVELKIVKYLVKPYNTKSFLDAMKKVSLELVDYQVDIALTKDKNYDQKKKVIKYLNGTTASLSKNEVTLLEYFILRKNQIIPFEDIYEVIWEYEEPNKEAVKHIVKGLRKKIDKNFIQNIYGVGYRLEI